MFNRLKKKITKVNKRLSNYETIKGRGESIGLQIAMSQNRYLAYNDLVKKINDFADRINIALDGGDREIGSSLVEWRQLVGLFNSYSKK